MSFKENLKEELLYQDIQYKEFAGMLNIPYSTMLSYINNTNTVPKVDTAYKMAKILNVSVEFLVTGNPEDNLLKQNLSIIEKELFSLPLSIISLIQNMIHSYYELYKTNTQR